MNFNSQEFRKFTGLFGAVCGSLLISVPAISQTAVAQQPTSVTPHQTTSKVNPCPSIFYEEPHNNRVLVPQGCPPNALTQRLANQGLLPTTRTVTQSPYQTGLGEGGETPQAGANALNPCPRIYYEEPFNSRNFVPQGCPPNAFSQGRQQQEDTTTQGGLMRPQISMGGMTQPLPGETTSQGGLMRPQTSMGGMTQPLPGETTSQVIPVTPQPSTGRTSTTGTYLPLPSQQQSPSATIALANGRVNINLVNDTAATITYQVIGDTAPRSLPGKSSVMLRGISAPTTVTFQREDGGLLSVTPQPASEQQGMLKVTFNEATDQSQDVRAMRIQQNGSVFLN